MGRGLRPPGCVTEVAAGWGVDAYGVSPNERGCVPPAVCQGICQWGGKLAGLKYGLGTAPLQGMLGTPSGTWQVTAGRDLGEQG